MTVDLICRHLWTSRINRFVSIQITWGSLSLPWDVKYFCFSLASLHMYQSPPLCRWCAWWCKKTKTFVAQRNVFFDWRDWLGLNAHGLLSVSLFDADLKCWLRCRMKNSDRRAHQVRQTGEGLHFHTTVHAPNSKPLSPTTNVQRPHCTWMLSPPFFIVFCLWIGLSLFPIPKSSSPAQSSNVG